jgi:hypothetical protein
MKILKYIGIALLVLIGIPLIAALFVSKDFNYEKSISINAPIDSVWVYTSSLNGLDKWSPWNDYDPKMKKTMTGTDGQVGAMSAWESDVDEVGKGSQTIKNIQQPNLFETTLKFYVPYESEAAAYVKLEPEGEGTKATWGFKSQMPYPMNFTMVVMDMGAMMDKDFTSGLSKLKVLCEK